MRLSSHLVKDLPYDLYAKACSITLRHRGFSRGHFRDARRDQHQYTTVVLATEGARLLGWALMVQCLAPNGKLNEYSVNFYVRHSARRRGVGSKLFSRVCSILGARKTTGHVCIWSPDSEIFYQRCRSPLINVIISPRYKGVILGTDD